MKKERKVLAIIPARGGSTRILNKNIRMFAGKPLIYHTIKQAKDSKFFDRVIVDTDSEEIAKVAKKYGAEVPFLRPAKLATSTAKVADSFLHLLTRLKKDEGYEPTHFAILQTTGPLREISDIRDSWELMQKTKATTVVTVCDTRPKAKDLCWLTKNTFTLPTNLISGPKNSALHGYNGLVYIIDTKAFLKEKTCLTSKTVGLVRPEWRSIDIDVAEEFVLAELLYKNKSKYLKRLEAFSKQKT